MGSTPSNSLTDSVSTRQNDTSCGRELDTFKTTTSCYETTNSSIDGLVDGYGNGNGDDGNSVIKSSKS